MTKGEGYANIKPTKTKFLNKEAVKKSDEKGFRKTDFDEIVGTW